MGRSAFIYLASLFSMSDEEAMRRVRQTGDPTAFAVLVRRWEGPIQRLCARMTGDVHRGEDLTQEAFARVFADRAQFREECRFGTFLWRVALNLCYDDRRRVARHKELSLDTQSGSDADRTIVRVVADELPEVVADRQEREEMVREAVASMPDIYRAVLVLRHYEGLKFREIADILELPEGTVKSRMAEALTRLARQLSPVLSDEALEQDPTSPADERRKR